MPRSPERILLRNPHITQEQLEAVRARWGLDRPLIPDQLVDYIASTATGDLGYSLKFQGKPVVDVIADSLWPTVLLIGLGEFVAITIGLSIGAYAGWKRGGVVDRVGSGISLILYSMPYFVIGMPLIIIFAAGLHWFPTSGMTSVGGRPTDPIGQLVDLGRHLVLPLVTVALGLIGSYSIIMRSAILETRSEDYMTTARAKGISDVRQLRSHALPNARREAWRLRLRGARDFARRFLRRRDGLVGVLVLLVFAVVAIAPGLFVGPLETAVSATGLPLDPPSSAHVLGTDELGRDMLN